MTRPSRYIIRSMAVVAYLSRPWSCGVVLGGIPFEGSPHSRLDYHGMGLLLAWATTLILSPLAWILIKRGSEQLPSLSSVDAGSAGVVFVILLFLGTPLFSQFAYLSALPLALCGPSSPRRSCGSRSRPT